MSEYWSLIKNYLVQNKRNGRSRGKFICCVGVRWAKFGNIFVDHYIIETENGQLLSDTGYTGYTPIKDDIVHKA